MYELFESNELDESLALIEESMNYKEAMLALRECSMPHCQVELYAVQHKFKEEYRRIRKEDTFAAQKYYIEHSSYSLIATKHNGKITKYY